MNEISQYFGKNPKKRDLSDGSKTGDDDSKKSRESSLGSELINVIFLRKVLSQLNVGKFYLTV